jgi:hypothetical protein
MTLPKIPKSRVVPEVAQGKESSLWLILKRAAEASGRDFNMTRIETWVMPGVPDVIMQDDAGAFHLIELKFTRAKGVDLSPHQVAWQGRHQRGSVWILVLSERKGKKELSLYHATQAVDLRFEGLDLEPKLRLSEPFDWSRIFGLISPI